MKAEGIKDNIFSIIGVIVVIGFIFLSYHFGRPLVYKHFWEPMVDKSVEKILQEKGLIE